MIPIHSRIIIIVFFYCRINKHFMIDMYNVFIVFMDTTMGLFGCTIREKKPLCYKKNSIIENRDLTHSKT